MISRRAEGWITLSFFCMEKMAGENAFLRHLNSLREMTVPMHLLPTRTACKNNDKHHVDINNIKN